MEMIKSTDIEHMIEFENKTWEVTSYIGIICLPVATICLNSFLNRPQSYYQILELTNSEVIIKGNYLYFCCIPGKYESHTNYGGKLSIENDCFCFWKINSNMGNFLPGWGCNKDLVQEIYLELNQRSAARGNQSILNQSEDTIKLLINLTKDIELIKEYLNVNHAEAIER